MLNSLVLDKMYNIGVAADKFMLNGEKTSIKDVCFVRYRFDEYNEEQLDYIEKMQNKFEYSTHMAEVTLSDRAAKDINDIAQRFENVAIYLYVPVTDAELEADEFDTWKQVLLTSEELNMTYVERVMLKDKTTYMHLIHANKFKKKLAELAAVEIHGIGICGSPLSVGTDACLHAIQARDLIAFYGNPEKCKIPSANHQCMQGCGCIHYTEITGDSAAPLVSKGGTKKEGSSSGTSKKGNGKAKASKAPIAWW